jgi:DNA-binding beta-propeller fold protein YncE
MSWLRLWRGWLAGLLSICVLVGVGAPMAQGAASDPLFVFRPQPTPTSGFLPPPFGFLEGPCGMGVDPNGRFYVSDYYHDAVDAYDQNASYNDPKATGATGYLGQLGAIDATDGPCALAFDASAHLYVNDYHRAVKRYGALGSFGAPTTITGATTAEATHPTGVAVDPATGTVYVDQRTHVSAFGESGAPLMTGPPGSEVPLRVGVGSLEDGYGIAFSSYPGTAGYLYVPDAATNTVEAYDTATPDAGPVEAIDGSETPDGEFVSLRDASIAVDRASGEIYLIDDLQPEYAESPQAIVYAFAPDGSYEGHLKSLITWGQPSGLAVDNSETATQGRVYVTSGNTALGSVYAYGPGAATTAAIKLPAVITSPPAGESGTLSGEAAGADCPSCEKEAAAGVVISEGVGLPSLSDPSSAVAKHRVPRHRRRAHRHGKVQDQAHQARRGGVARGR